MNGSPFDRLRANGFCHYNLQDSVVHEKTTLQRQIAATDRQIDKLVYDLYGLTEEEIKIVEKS